MNSIILFILMCTSTYATNSCLEDCELDDVSLGRLLLSDCGLSEEDIESGDLEQCFNNVGKTDIKILWLSQNNFETLQVDMFRGLSNLEELELGFNGLESIEEDVFQEVPKLTYLFLGYNDLSTLPGGVFRGLTNLDELVMLNNNFRTLSSDTFDELTSLTELTLANNDLISLPDDIFYGTTNLYELRLSGNSLYCLPISTATVISADDGVPDCSGSGSNSATPGDEDDFDSSSPDSVPVSNSATLGAPGGIMISVLFAMVSIIVGQ